MSKSAIKNLRKGFQAMARAFELIDAGFAQLDQEGINLSPPPPARVKAPKATPSVIVPPSEPSGDQADELTKTERKLLTALAQAGKRLSLVQIGVRTGLSHRGGSFNATMTRLSRAGCVVRFTDGVEITTDGLAALGTFARLPDGPELFDYWVAKAGTTSGKILSALRAGFRSGVSALTKEEIGESCGLSSGGGSFNAALTKLKRLELIRAYRGGFALSDELQQAAEPTVRVFNHATGQESKHDRRGHRL